jgi:hypothetical protein
LHGKAGLAEIGNGLFEIVNANDNMIERQGHDRISPQE